MPALTLVLILNPNPAPNGGSQGGCPYGCCGIGLQAYMNGCFVELCEEGKIELHGTLCFGRMHRKCNAS